MFRASAWAMAAVFASIAGLVLLGAMNAVRLQGPNGLVLFGTTAGVGLLLAAGYVVGLALSVRRVELLCEAMAQRMETFEVRGGGRS